MIKHIWTIICRMSVTDEDTHNISLIEALHQIRMQGTPTPSEEEPILFAVEYEVITLWSRIDESTPIRGKGLIEVVSPAGTVLGEFPYDIDLTNSLDVRIRMKHNLLPITASGTYSFRISLSDENRNQWKEVSSVPLKVVFI